jgi:hypothetical protein
MDPSAGSRVTTASIGSSSPRVGETTISLDWIAVASTSPRAKRLVSANG